MNLWPSRAILLIGTAGMVLLSACREATGPSSVINSLELTPDSVRIAFIGDTVQLHPTVGKNSAASAPILSWSSSDTTVAAVTAGGIVRAVGYGRAEIEVRVDTLTARALVTVGERGVGRWSVGRPPAFTNEILRSVWAPSPQNIFVGGSGGNIWHYDGARWTRMATGTEQHFEGFWGTSEHDIFAVGYQFYSRTPVAHFDGTRWTPMDVGESTSGLFGISGTSSDDVFAAGYEGKIFHYDGKTWSRMQSGTTANIWDVWAVSPRDVFAASDAGILRFDGTRWSITPIGSLMAVWGASATDVYAAGRNEIYHFDGRAWTRVVSASGDPVFWSLWGTSARDVYATGRNGVYHFDGSTWSVSSDPGNLLKMNRGIGGTGPSDVFVVGDYGLVMRWDGAVWKQEAWGAALRGIWGTSGGSLISVGTAGAVVRLMGGSWTTEFIGWGSFGAVTGTPSGSVYAAAVDGDLYRLSGSSLTPTGNGGIRGLWTDAAGAIYTVQNADVSPGHGSYGSSVRSIQRYADGAWTQIWYAADARYPSLRRLIGIWGRGGDDLFVVGEKGTIMHCAAFTCTTMPSQTTRDLRAVGGGASGAVFAVGDGGTILRNDGESWVAVESGTTRDLFSVWASSESNVYVVGDGGTLLRFDGKRWSLLQSGTTEPLYSVWGVSSDEVYAVGEKGVLVKGIP